jgi:hypothetical protein
MAWNDTCLHPGAVDEATFAPSEKTSILILHFQHLVTIKAIFV